MPCRIHRRGAEAGGTSVSPTAREVVLPYIDQSLAEKYTLSIRRNDKTRTMVVRVEEKGGV